MPGFKRGAAKLSRKQGYYDRFEVQSRKAVKKARLLCQVLSAEPQSCQESEVIMPGFKDKSEKLSEHDSTSDRFGGKG